MAEPTYSLQRVLALRKMTRAISDLLRGQVKEYLATLGPALRPKNVFGDYVQGTAREAPRGPEKAFKELQDLYGAVTAAKPFGFSRELTPPLEIANTVPELLPMEYAHTVHSGGSSKSVLVTSPLQWVMTYSGFSPGRLKELLAARNPEMGELARFVLHYCVISVVMARQPGLARMFEALRFPVRTLRVPEFGNLPLTSIAAPVATVRPPDDVILDSTELSGKDVFEEIIQVEDIRNIRDPLKEQLAGIAAGFGEDAAAGA